MSEQCHVMRDSFVLIEQVQVSPVWVQVLWNDWTILDVRRANWDCWTWWWWNSTSCCWGEYWSSIVDDLGRYMIDVAALQETKLFGEVMYRIWRSIVLAAGRPVPGANIIRYWWVGVTIVLSSPAVDTWKAGGNRWKLWSSRLVS